MTKRIVVLALVFSLIGQVVAMSSATASTGSTVSPQAVMDVADESFAAHLLETRFGTLARRLARLSGETAPVDDISAAATRALRRLSDVARGLQVPETPELADALRIAPPVNRAVVQAFSGLSREQAIQVLSVLKYGAPSHLRGTLWPGKCIGYYVLAVLDTLLWGNFYFYWVAYFPAGPFVVIFGAVDMAICLATPPLDPV